SVNTWKNALKVYRAKSEKMFGNAAPFSYSPRGFTAENQPPFSRGFQQDEPRNVPLQRNNTSRPNGKAIYSQRKEHIEKLNKQDNIHYRVEHLFTCELNGQKASSLDDCVAKLKTLDAKGRLWPQDMILDSELESLPLGSILQTKAVLNSCAYNSLLMVIMQDRYKGSSQVYMFQCEEVGAEFIKSDLDKVVQGNPADMDNHANQFNIRNNLENIVGQRAPGSFRNPRPQAMLDRPPPQPQAMLDRPPPQPQAMLDRPPPQPQAMLDRPPPQPEEPSRQWSNRDFEHTPAPQLYALPPQESQYNAGFDMLQNRQESLPMTEYTDIDRDTGKLNGELTIPSAADFVHILFTSLQTRWHCTSWARRTRWPGGDAIPPYLPEFYDGWQIPPPSSQMEAISRNNSQHFPAPPSHNGPLYDRQSSREMQGPPEELRNGSPWSSPPPPNRSQPPMSMRVIYDFMARNSQELSVLKGDVVQQGAQDATPTLNLMSSPADVRAWLEYKRFSKITVQSLGVLNGKLLLGMSRDDIRMVCPEDGGKVFFQLQPIKSAIALASEPGYGHYNGHY
ncbi:hypothetical protein CRUP_034084, partial [Coryphaenoides rupestris]